MISCAAWYKVPCVHLLLGECVCWFREQDQPKMPVLFSLSHPLDEIAPVICRTGGMPAVCCFEIIILSFIRISHCMLPASLDIPLTYWGCHSCYLSECSWYLSSAVALYWLPAAFSNINIEINLIIVLATSA